MKIIIFTILICITLVACVFGSVYIEHFHNAAWWTTTAQGTLKLIFVLLVLALVLLFTKVVVDIFY